MGFLGDLFAAKGIVEASTAISGMPAGGKALYKLGFARVPRAKAPPPRGATELKWTSTAEHFTVTKSLPAGWWQVQVLVTPVLPQKDGATKKDATRAVPFWPLAEAFEVPAGGLVRIKLEVAFPKAALG